MKLSLTLSVSLVIITSALTSCTTANDATTNNTETQTQTETITSPFNSYFDLTSLEAQAWTAFDASNTASQLPDHSTRVTFIGFNQTGFPYAQDNHLVVTDSQGYYLFSY